MIIFLCGDVMTGRGIDQLLPHPSKPELHEDYLKSAQGYIELAEAASGPIPRPAGFDYIWGDALEELRRARPDVRIINLETSVTTSDDWLGKGINYRMHPDNIGCLAAAGVNACALSNNHVLDWGRAGLVETLGTLKRAGIRTAGAGRELDEARAPAIWPVAGQGRVVLFSLSTEDSGVPPDWAAAPERPGVDFLADLSAASVRELRDRVARVKRPRDVVIVSIHWGGNWGFDIPASQRRFSRAWIPTAPSSWASAWCRSS